jgi:hypothetical protein
VTKPAIYSKYRNSISPFDYGLIFKVIKNISKKKNHLKKKAVPWG